MANKVWYDWEKTTEVLLYITEQVTDVYNALKVLYFADKDHLAKYGRQICGESYVAMKDGPVPSCTYDLVKAAGWQEGRQGESEEVDGRATQRDS